MPERDPSPLYAYFGSRSEVRKFANTFLGGELEIEGAGVDFSEGTGYVMRQIYRCDPYEHGLPKLPSKGRAPAGRFESIMSKLSIQ
jgi:hypothetical protein